MLGLVFGGRWLALADEVPYIPTPRNLVEAMLAIAEAAPQDYVVDLGSGNDRIVIAAAKQYRARALGIDYDHAAARTGLGGRRAS